MFASNLDHEVDKDMRQYQAKVEKKDREEKEALMAKQKERKDP